MNIIIVSLEEIVDTDLSINSSSSDHHNHQYREESFDQHGFRNRFKSSQQNREQMR